MQDIESKLLSIWDRVNDWLKFAEAKNAGILVFSGSTIAALLSFLGSSRKIQLEWRIGIYTGIAFLSIACLMAIWSFIPKTKIIFKNFGQPSDTDNLYFYRHLCKYNPQQLVETISRLYYDNDPQAVTRNNKDIAAQIVINSCIAMEKYQIFKIAAWIVLIGLLSIVIVPGIIMVYKGGC
jgi:hypothetical protein